MSVPVTILAGFLGSGKTTLLNHLLAAADGRRLGVIVNDFGAVTIDVLLTSGGQDVVELPGGCICCALRDGLVAAVERVVRAGAAAAVVETTGLADPYPVAEAIRSAGLAGLAHLDAVVTVVDGERHGENRGVDPVCDDQVRAADLIVVNKTDRLPPGALDGLTALLQRQNRRAAVLPTVHGRVAPAVVLETGLFAGLPEQPHRHGPLHKDLVSVGWQAAASLDRDAFAAFLRRLPPGVLRAKAVVGVAGEARRMIVQQVGGRRTVEWGEPWPAGAAESRALLIGRGLEPDALLAALEGCRAAESPAGLPSGGEQP